MRVILLGPPGAGKGTLAKSLKESLDMAHISSGDILREEMNRKTLLGNKVKEYIETGQLVPDEIVTKIIESRLTRNQTEESYLLDGFPRTETQARDLDQILSRIQKPIDLVIYMESTLPVIIQRLAGRRVCKVCGALFHVVNKPPKIRGICDVCGGPLYERPDDQEDTIKTRMEVYLKNTAPIIEYYAAQGKLKKINANQDAEVVKEQLMRLFDEKASPQPERYRASLNRKRGISQS